MRLRICGTKGGINEVDFITPTLSTADTKVVMDVLAKTRRVEQRYGKGYTSTLVESGWQGLAVTVVDDDAIMTDRQYKDEQAAFMAQEAAKAKEAARKAAEEEAAK